MNKIIDWRKIESALVDYAKSEGLHVVQPASGSSFVEIPADQFPELDLTDLAKQLAERLK